MDAKKISERLLKSDEKNVWSIYYYALSEGYISLLQSLSENWFDALSSGLNSVAAFEDCLKSMDKNFSEALIAIGSYKFWKSKKTEFINWMPFYDDEKDLGIEYLEKAVNHSSYNYPSGHITH